MFYVPFYKIRQEIYREVHAEEKILYPKKPKPKKPKVKLTEEDTYDTLMKSDRKYAFTARDIYEGYKKKLNLTPEQYLNLNMTKTYGLVGLFGNILADTIFLIMQDIILNNSTVQFQGVGGFAEICMYAVKGDEFKKARQNGEYQDVDFLVSNFTAYRPELIRYSKRDSLDIHKTSIILDPKFKRDLTKQINVGKNYYVTPARKIDSYIEQVQELYPNIKLEVLSAVIKYGIKQVYLCSKQFLDVLIKKDGRYVYFGNIKAYCGTKPENYYGRQLRKKLYKLWFSKEIKWDGYYYFCLSEPEYKKYFSKSGNSRTKNFSFNTPKLLSKSPDIAYVFYRRNKYMVRLKAKQSFGFYRFIRPYIEIQGVELYQYKESATIESLSPKNHKYKILCQRKRQ